MAEIPFRREMRFEYGAVEQVTPLVRRIIARNPGPFTYTGTGTYVVGHGRVAIIDPGPALTSHVEAVLAALGGETVSHILVTHTHLDHSPAAAAVKAATGAPSCGFGPHGGGAAGGPQVEEGGDRDFAPDLTLREGNAVEGPGWRLEAVETPGHTSNHLCFALPEERILFSGDHVMGWSTSVVAPPDGDMRAYLASLEKLLAREDAAFWPTHGPAIDEPKRHVAAFIAHRQERNAAILGRLAAGDETISALVAAIYAGLDPRLVPAAGRSVLAHLIMLAEDRTVESDGPPGPEARFRLRR